MGIPDVVKPAFMALLFAVIQGVQADIHFYTFNAPPYQIVDRSNPQAPRVGGETVETVVCGASQAGVPISVKVAPQNRSVYSLRRNLIDGYFAIDSSDELDAVGVRSAPIALEKWYFFSSTPEFDPHTDRLGVVSGSNEGLWLQENGYQVFLSVSDVEQLLALIRRGRIDGALMDQRLMDSLNSQTGQERLPLHRQFLRYAPLHLYLSERFIDHNPAFVSQFNRSIPECVSSSFTLDEHERQLLAGQASLLFDDLRKQIDVEKAVRVAPRISSFADILTIDIKWRAVAHQAVPELAGDILQLEASEQLGAWQSRQLGLVTETMIANNLGTVSAMSQVTSDYWQGDEAKFQEAAAGEPLYLSPIRYDASTQRFQVVASTPIRARSTGAFEGILVIGLDVEEALSRVD